MRAFAPVWNELAKRYTPMGFDFVVVYILEAHAEDEWPISSSKYHPDGEVVRVKQHKSSNDRIDAAIDFDDVYDIGDNSRFLIDSMDNSFNEQFAAWPFRFESYLFCYMLVLYRKKNYTLCDSTVDTLSWMV